MKISLLKIWSRRLATNGLLNASQSVEWQAELLTKENDGPKKSGQDNMPDDAHKLAWVQLMRETRAQNRPESARIEKKCKFNSLTRKTITPSLPVQRPSIAGQAAPTAEEMADVDAYDNAVISKDGCCEAIANVQQQLARR